MSRLPPHNPSAEAQVIGSLLIRPELVAGAKAVLTPDSFFVPVYRHLFKAIVAEYEATGFAGMVEVMARARAGAPEHLAAEVGIAIEHAPESVTTIGNIEYFCGLVKQHHVRRTAIGIAESLNVLAYDDCEDIGGTLQKIEAEIITAVSQMESQAPRSAAEIGTEYMQMIDMRRANPNRTTGLETGIWPLDRITGGRRPSELTIIAARPSMGKTAIALNFLYKWSVIDNIPVAFFSLEMAGQALMNRLVSLDSGIPQEAVRDVALSPSQYDQLRESVHRVSRAPLFIQDEQGRNMSQIRAEARALRNKHGIQLVVTDYLQYVQPEKGSEKKSMYEQVSEISRGCKALAKELGIHHIALSQLSRECEGRSGKEKGRPQQSDLRQSGQIEQDADIIEFIWRPEKNKIEQYEVAPGRIIPTEGLIIYDVDKDRNGRTGTVPLFFHLDSGRIGELDLRG